ncbi:MAG: regulator [Methylophaga sp.]|nr:MAG: regulator [Methylophaga sp.]
MNTFGLNSESTLTDRYQTTIPETVRKVLRLHKRDKVRYSIQANGDVLISRAETDDADPVLDGFLNLLASDLSHNPSRLTALDSNLANRAKILVSGIDIGLNAALSDEDE